VASLGVLAYAMGKFPSGWLADFWGGRRIFLFGMAGSIVFTVLFSLAGGIPLFTLAWMGNRSVQSLGWAGMVKITSRWFSCSAYGTAMGVISLSYLFGDAAARELPARLLDARFGWHGLFLAAAAELVAMGTILAADWYGLPVSTTHVLSSGVAGMMAANHSGLQMATLRNLLLAWVLTLPVTVLLGAGIFAFVLNVLLRFGIK